MGSESISAGARLARKLSALPEMPMRKAVLRESIVTHPPAVCAEILYEVLRLARVNPSNSPYAEAILALAEVLGDDTSLPYGTRTELYDCCRLAGYDALAHLFMSASHQEGADKVPGPEVVLVPSPQGKSDKPVKQRNMGSPLPSDLRGKPITLGERKSLARSSRREMLDYLMRDPDARVIEILLGNPRMVERDVLLIASRRPVHPDILVQVFRSRWIRRRTVRRALIFNPSTPLSVASALLGAMADKDLEEISNDPQLSYRLRDHAVALQLVGKPPSRNRRDTN